MEDLAKTFKDFRMEENERMQRISTRHVWLFPLDTLACCTINPPLLLLLLLWNLKNIYFNVMVMSVVAKIYSTVAFVINVSIKNKTQTFHCNLRFKWILIGRWKTTENKQTTNSWYLWRFGTLVNTGEGRWEQSFPSTAHEHCSGCCFPPTVRAGNLKRPRCCHMYAF